MLAAGGLVLALATPALAEDSPDTAVDATTGEPIVTTLDPAEEVRFGVGFRARNVRVPTAMIELFTERAAGGASNLGLGIDLTRRKGNSELQLGFEYEHITPGEGVWIASGDNVPGDEADYLLSPDRAPGGEKLGWFTVEFTYLHHTPLTKSIALRYGGGLGLGIVTGALYKYDVPCAAPATNDNPEPGCVPAAIGMEAGNATNARGPTEYDLPPVFPVINAIFGVQFRPNDDMTINVEGGLRTFPFFGVSGSYFF